MYRFDNFNCEYCDFYIKIKEEDYKKDEVECQCCGRLYCTSI